MLVGILIFINYQKDMNIEEEYEYIENTEEYVDYEENEINRIFVYVAGEVKNPGVVELNDGDRVQDAVSKAGGITEKANLININLAKFVEDGEKIYIPNEEENINNIENEKSSVKVNINRATLAELQSLNGIGPAMASKIIEYRKLNGPFKSIEDLKNVSGIGESKFKELENYVTI